MRFYADLHVHSKHSRACSRDLDLEHLAWWAARKGIAVVGTGDFTHPAWLEELRSKLVPAEPGLFRLRAEIEQAVLQRLPAHCRRPVRFLLATEISTIYKSGDRTRKVHHLLYAPDFEAVAKITRQLARIGNLASDGRPILGLDSRDLLEITLESGSGCYLIPAHVWTPWFAALGSQSGFGSIQECYGDLAGNIFAVETGLSSDPAMNWQVSDLDRYRLVSNSDAHSPPMLGREATAFDTELDYFAILQALRSGEGLGGTVEFFPEEGKYHLDGHRACEVRLEPEQTRELAGRCPKCNKPLTVGVLHRVSTLADHPSGRRPGQAQDYQCLLQLPEILGELLGVGARSKSVEDKAAALVGRFGSELEILTDIPLEEISPAGPPLLAEALNRLRRGEVFREAGYDGVYGTIRLFTPDELATATSPMLFDVAPLEPAPLASPILPESPNPESANKSSQPSAALPPPSSKLDGLDSDQRAAATASDGPLLIVAGPGTGKTRTLTHLLAHRVRNCGVAPSQCLAVTFTRRACREMRERLEVLLPEQAGRVLVTTFHGLGLRLLRELHDRFGLSKDLRVVDEELRLSLLHDVLERDGGSLGRVAAQLSEAKRVRALSRSAPQDHKLERILARYDAALRQRDLVDLDDLVTLPTTALEDDEPLASEYRQRWPEICVDEYQDIDEAQYRLLRLLCQTDGNIRAIGDPDQAIYGFRGADVGFFLRFREDFPAARVVHLTRNYRSTPTIVRAALQAIAPTTLVPDRILSAVQQNIPDGPAVVHRSATEQEEAATVADHIEGLLGGASFLALDRGESDGRTSLHCSFSDFAVLYRTDAQSPPVVEALARKGFPCQKRSHEKLTDSPGVRALLEALREQKEQDAEELPVVTRLDQAIRALPEPVEAAVELLHPLALDCGTNLDRFFTELALGEEVDTWDPRAERIALLTLHAAKGLEFPVVFIIGCEDGLLPLRWSGRAQDSGPQDEEAEERRLFFVGMTRATTQLVLTSSERRVRSGRPQTCKLSPYLADIDPTLLEHRQGPLNGRPGPPKQARQLQLF
jgi:DNA helicase-2/ATP-dependent DNA helicase PcrA